MVRFLRYCLLVLLTLFFIAFAISNREAVSLSFFPLPYTAETPLFILVLIAFVLGAAVAALVGFLTSLRKKFDHLSAQHRVAALENEIAGLKAERNVMPPAA